MATNTKATTNKQTTEREHVLIINGKRATQSEYDRIVNAKAQSTTNVRGTFQPKPFSLL